jgi:hypothetical protein
LVFLDFLELADSFGDRFGDCFGNSFGDGFGGRFADSFGDRFGNSFGDGFGGRFADSFGDGFGDRFGVNGGGGGGGETSFVPDAGDESVYLVLALAIETTIALTEKLLRPLKKRLLLLL